MSRGKEIAEATRALDVQIAGNHYKEMAIQVVEYNMANKIPYMEGNVIKYVSRWRNKGGIEDLKKAKHYLELLIENEEKEIDTRNKICKLTTTSEPRPETTVYHSTYSPT